MAQPKHIKVVPLATIKEGDEIIAFGKPGVIQVVSNFEIEGTMYLGGWSFALEATTDPTQVVSLCQQVNFEAPPTVNVYLLG